MINFLLLLLLIILLPLLLSLHGGKLQTTSLWLPKIPWFIPPISTRKSGFLHINREGEAD